jgi:hypothetical protein
MGTDGAGLSLVPGKASQENPGSGFTHEEAWIVASVCGGHRTDQPTVPREPTPSRRLRKSAMLMD